MKIFFAGTSNIKNAFFTKRVNTEDLNVLESFYSIQPWQIPFIPHFRDFLLDSGAFTFLNSKKGERMDFERYAEQYAEFIKQNNIKKYFELDVDSIIGLEKTEKLRERIERITGVKSIPVWHKNRGKQYFIDMCKEYPYVAIGGIAIKEIPIKIFEQAFPWFINTAHENNCKIHGLGYTNQKGLHKYHFDSVDSTTWNNGGRYGELDEYAHGTIIIHRSVHNGKKIRVLKNPQEINVQNLIEWAKFNKYAEVNL